MKWGLIARAESDRGLGVLTRLMAENLLPDRILLITIPGSEYRQETAWSAGFETLVVPWDGGDLSEPVVRQFLDGLDVVVSAEIFYDWNVVLWARDMKVRTVLYVMPELFKRELLDGTLPMPDQFWYPTKWKPSTTLPEGNYLPVPCEHRTFVDYPEDDQLQVIHTAGKPALADRNGTNLVALVSKRARPQNLTVYGQGALPRFNSNVTVLPGPDDKWKMYEGAHLLLLPRRYGGLCLPVIEALSCGLAVTMPAISPNIYEWPIIRMDASPDAVVEMPVGQVQTYTTSLIDIERVMAPGIVTGPTVRTWMSKARAWAQENTWEKRKHTFYEALS